MRRRPYQCILLDEFEKSHRDVSNLLLQVFDEGRLSDSHGRIADFKNTVIILTSNLGSDLLYRKEEGEEAGKEDSKALIEEKRAKLALQLVNHQFSPEFVNRIDDVVLFSSLDIDSIKEITKIQLGKVQRLLKDKSIDISISDLACSWLAEAGYDPQYGARPLKRLIQSQLMNPLASSILSQEIVAGDKIFVTVETENTPEAAKKLLLQQQNKDSLLRFFVVSK